MKRIYLDNAATTPMYKAVFRSMKPYLLKHYGNPSSLHKEGRIAFYAIENSRNIIANLLNCYPDEIFFTSGASESNSWVCKNFGYYCSEFSHDSIKMANMDNKNKELVSYPLIDSELGKRRDIINKQFYNCHVDLTQAIGKIKIDLHEHTEENNFKYATASFSAHKFGGPKGIGILFIRRDIQNCIKPLIYGHQQQALRGGTENVPAIVGMAKALEIATKNMDKNNIKIYKMLKLIIENLSRDIDIWSGINTINITFKTLSAQTAVSLFNQEGVAVSAGSACNSMIDEPSKILLADGYTKEEALKTIRVTIGVHNTRRQIKKFIKIAKKIIDNYDNVRV